MIHMFSLTDSLKNMQVHLYKINHFPFSRDASRMMSRCVMLDKENHFHTPSLSNRPRSSLTHKTIGCLGNGNQNSPIILKIEVCLTSNMICTSKRLVYLFSQLPGLRPRAAKILVGSLCSVLKAQRRNCYRNPD